MLSRVALALGLLSALLFSAGCSSDVEMRETAAPWDAPQPAVYYIQEAGLDLHDLKGHQAVIDLHNYEAPTFAKFYIYVNGEEVAVPQGIGMDPTAEMMSSLHTHEDDGVVTVELNKGEMEPNIADFFHVWGVRYNDRCLGDTCGTLKVLINSEEAEWDAVLPKDGMVEVHVDR